MKEKTKNNVIEEFVNFLEEGYDGISLKHLIDHFFYVHNFFDINEFLDNKEKRKKMITENAYISARDKLLLYGLLGDIKTKRKKQYHVYEKIEYNKRENITQEEQMEYEKKLVSHHQIILCFLEEDDTRKKMEQSYLLKQAMIKYMEKLEREEMEYRKLLNNVEEMYYFIFYVEKEKEETFFFYEKRHAAKLSLFQSFLFVWNQIVVNYINNKNDDDDDGENDSILNILEDNYEQKEQCIKNENVLIKKRKKKNK